MGIGGARGSSSDGDPWSNNWECDGDGYERGGYYDVNGTWRDTTNDRDQSDDSARDGGEVDAVKKGKDKDQGPLCRSCFERGNLARNCREPPRF